MFKRSNLSLYAHIDSTGLKGALGEDVNFQWHNGGC